MVKQLNITQEKFKGLKCLLFDYAYVQGIFNGVSNFLGFHLGKLTQLQFRPLSCSRGHHLKVCFIRATKQGSKLYCKLH